MELIDPKKLIDEKSYDALMHDSVTGEHIYVQVVDVGDIEEFPIVDAVPRPAVDQIRWERDMAMQQLEEIGVAFCGKADDVVKVVRCKVCKRALKYEDGVWCCATLHPTKLDGYCHHGERKEAQDGGNV